MGLEQRRNTAPSIINRALSRRSFLKIALPGLLSGCATASGLAEATLEAAPRRSTPISLAPLPDETPVPSPTAMPPPATHPPAEPAPELPVCRERVPVIGIVAHHLYAPSYTSHVDGQIDSYRRAVAGAGGAPLLIPTGLHASQWRAIYDVLDGILFPGGVDVDPATYNEAPHPRLGEVDPALDRAELTLARWALAEDLPLLGVCRGAQLLNVAAGGSLIQDIPSQWPGALVHATSAVDAHMVTVRPGTQLSTLLDVTECMTNSRHHQAAKDVGEGFLVSAHTSDGVIEAVERAGAPFCIGVQWHPENLVDHDPVMQRLFEAFVAAAAYEGGCVPQ